jgi:hypothetical protein
VGDFTERTALTLADVAEDVSNLMTQNYHLALLLLFRGDFSQAHIAPADYAIDGYGLLDHVYQCAPCRESPTCRASV